MTDDLHLLKTLMHKEIDTASGFIDLILTILGLLTTGLASLPFEQRARLAACCHAEIARAIYPNIKVEYPS